MIYTPPTPIPDDQLPPIAVGILSYNRAKEVMETLDIMLASDYPKGKLHLIVVDNASSDNTRELVQQRYGARVDVMTLPENIGAIGRNKIILGTEERYSFMFDEDCAPADPSTFRRVIEFMEANPYFGVLALNSINLHTGLTELPSWPKVATRRHAEGVYEGVYVAGNGMCFRREAVKDTVGYDERLFWGSEEFAFSLELLYYDIPIAFVADYALVHRRAPRAMQDTEVMLRETRNTIWASLIYFPMPLTPFVALSHPVRRFLISTLKKRPDKAKAALLGARIAFARTREFYGTRKPIPLRRVLHHGRWFFEVLFPFLIR